MAEEGEGERGVDGEGAMYCGEHGGGHEHGVSQRVQSVVHQPYESLTLFGVSLYTQSNKSQSRDNKPPQAQPSLVSSVSSSVQRICTIRSSR